LAGMFIPWWSGAGPPQWRGVSFGYGGGLIVDWDLKTNLEGLYATGNQVMGACSHTIAATSGRYAGRTASAYALNAQEPVIHRKQIQQEKARVYRPVKQKDGIGWKELQAGLSRVMQDYCGEYKTESLLKTGLEWLNSIRESEAAHVCARNPHELMRTLECMSRLTVGELIMHASLARKASSPRLNFSRLDYPQIDPPEWNKFITTRMQNGKVQMDALPYNYWLLPPNVPSFKENYEKHSLR